MKKLNLTANLGLKIASLLFAALLWFLVTNISDPVDSVRFSNVPVTLRNTNSITDNNQVYQVLEDSDVISTVSVYAPRSIVDSLNKENVVAIADLENTTNIDGTYYVAIQLSTNKYSNQIQSISGSIDSVQLSIEDRAKMVDYFKDLTIQDIASTGADTQSTGLAQMLYENMKRNYNL